MKKGFTIIEIILSLSLILVIGISGLIIYRNKAKEKTLENMKEKIYLAVNILIETEPKIKKQLYESKNGAIIPLKKLENEGLIDFSGLNIEDEYVLSMLGSTEESEKCSGTLYNIGSWTKSQDDVIYICGNATVKDDYPNLLKDAIIYNAKKADGTTDRSILDLTNSSSWDKKLIKNGDEYWFSNAVMDNFVTFNNMCWRILNIQSDGSIRLLLQNQDSNCSTNYGFKGIIGNGHYGYSTFKDNRGRIIRYAANYLDSENDKENSTKYILDKWFEDNFDENDKKSLKLESWKLTDTITGLVEVKQNGSTIVFTETTDDFDTLFNKMANYEIIAITYNQTKTFSSYIGIRYKNDVPCFSEYPDCSLSHSLGVEYTLIHSSYSGDGPGDRTFGTGTGAAPLGLHIYGNHYYDNGRVVNQIGPITPVIVLKNDVKIIDGYGTPAKPYVIAE